MGAIQERFSINDAFRLFYRPGANRIAPGCHEQAEISAPEARTLDPVGLAVTQQGESATRLLDDFYSGPWRAGSSRSDLIIRLTGHA